jgi:hypothetical protein
MSIRGIFVVCPRPGRLVPDSITLTHPDHAWEVQPDQKTQDTIDQAVVTNRNDSFPTPAKSEKDEILVSSYQMKKY